MAVTKEFVKSSYAEQKTMSIFSRSSLSLSFSTPTSPFFLFISLEWRDHHSAISSSTTPPLTSGGFVNVASLTVRPVAGEVMLVSLPSQLCESHPQWSSLRDTPAGKVEISRTYHPIIPSPPPRLARALTRLLRTPQSHPGGCYQSLCFVEPQVIFSSIGSCCFVF